MGCSGSKPAGVEANKSLLLSDSDHKPKEGMQKLHGVQQEQTPVVNTPKPVLSKAPPPPKQQPAKPQHHKPFNRAKDRVDAINESQTITCDGVTMRYAYLSQRGFYPDDPFKANQDAYCVQDKISSSNSRVYDTFFGVFDGHGNDGDGCAIYAKNNLAKNLTYFVDKMRSNKGGNAELTKDQVQSALLKAHVETNKALHKNPNVDDSLSGTTAISLYFHGRRNRITIANVGDSRAVLGQDAAPRTAGPRKESARSTLKAQPLSRDQTPYRKDERARIKATGARVLSLDQLEGLEPINDGSENEDDFELGEELDEGGDPPRVWSPHGDFPGTAFTRSIGDHMAEELGVFAEPEMLTREIVPEDRIIVLASDGVFEFLTNQSVVDICAKFADPLEACRAVVAEAYELWLQYELRTDDITIITIFIDDVKEHDAPSSTAVPSRSPALSNGPSTADDVVDTILTTEGLRPVRKNVSKEKSKAIEKLKRGSEHAIQEDEVDLTKLASTKTPEEKASIAEAIKASIMFRNITEEQRNMIFDCMESVHVKKGAWVIRQGSAGDRFYIIDEGFFEVRILPDGMEDEDGQGGNIVHVYEGSRQKHAHPSFGELALMYSAPRSASIVAKSDGHLWALHRSAFRQVLIQAQDHRKELKKVLVNVPYFQNLDSDGINKLAAIMDEITFGRGENIVEQGQPGNFLYVIASGSCYTVQVTQGGTKRAQIKAGMFFGDDILSHGGRYDTTVVALQTTNCWQLDANVLKQTMGPLLQGLKDE